MSWSIPIFVVAIFAVAALVNRFAPERRRRLRRIVVIFGFHLVALGASYAVAPLSGAWERGLLHAADLFATFTIINLVVIGLFDLALPKAKVAVASIVSDLAIGISYIVATLAVLSRAGANPSSVVASGAVVSGILAISLQTTLGNILGGVALQLDGSVHVGEWIQLDNGRQGRVKEIRWRHTVVETRDWGTMIVPNSSLLAQNILILGKRDGESVPHRMWVFFNVDFRYPPQRVVQVVTDALHASPIERVARDPLPNVICMDLARDGKDSFGLYAVRYWLTDLAADDPTNSAVRARIYAALRRADIPLARPTHSVFVDPDDEVDRRAKELRQQENRLRLVRGMDLFKSLTEEELVTLVGHLRSTPFTRGETITRQGAVAHWLYLVAAGEAEVLRRVDGVEAPRLVATLTAPDFFGEMGLMTGEPRQADVVAKTDVECLRLDKAGFEAIIMKRPELAREMSIKLAHRRVELQAVKEGLDVDAKRAREASEQERILERIQEFFGLGG